MSGSNTELQVPKTGFAGLKQNLQKDLISGFLVFLIALPLCLGIALACGYPAISGIFTAIIGAILTTFISDSALTIKGPAAGLIVIAIGAITEFGFTAGQDPASDLHAYQLVLGIGVAAGCIQILFGLFRVGSLGDFFPLSVVHGMLAAIGIIIMLKQFPIAMGGHAEGEPFELILSIPAKIIHMNPCIAAIGVGSLAIMFGVPLIKNKYVKMMPTPMFVLMFAVPLGMYFGLSHEHAYHFEGREYMVGDEYLVNVPGNMFKAMTHPDFSSLMTFSGWKWVIMFALIGSLESLLSAKAIDIIDPWKRKTNLNRDLLAVGIGNTICAFIGGLPMISEIVRSKANIDNGARTRFADLYHGLFLLIFVGSVPFLLHHIPLAALAAMLVYTGFQLTAPREYLHVYRIGREQLIMFVVTIVAVLATDLIIGIAIGIGTKFLIHYINGAPIRSFFKPYLGIVEIDNDSCTIRAAHAIIFSNWIPFKKQIERVGLNQNRNVIVDLTDTTMVDHSVMEKLHEMEEEFRQNNIKLEVIGLDQHKSLSDHQHSTRRRGFEKIRRIIVFVDSGLQSLLEHELTYHGVRDFTTIACGGTGTSTRDRLRIEVLTLPDKAEHILDELRREILPKFGKQYGIRAFIENVEAIMPDYTQYDVAVT
ncbi:MAG: SulP family inorganic anion transporter [Candidatus Scalindua rubra]|uniref:High affinity sulfate transporter (Plant) n=1 Tax=Candidatus Scalindua brodae TaxID=237368 RepID=A0A0B0ENH7_9BACT|nr:MAG: high affinity sulfate transporter (plant) [Candidatus Scalindua brodae]MBZ0107835.1 SulP family inorganic anion transporter [Candidatus Scalindua rubra]TWU29200.1 Bicarbonate transporter BicA [Candidatus Brocadiaceae bacterium S225]